MDEKLELLKKWIDESDSIVFFGGAGVSTESGIPDFRSPDGIYSKKYKYPPEYMLSHEFFVSKTSEFYEFYRSKMIPRDAKPNITHIKLAELESAGKLKAVITQNIDGLHQAAGSNTVYELHGSIYRNSCTRCLRKYPLEYVDSGTGVPLCECGGTVKPDVVLYGESLNQKTLSDARMALASCDLLIVGGTSLTVYPAAGLIEYYRGNRLVLINKTETPRDSKADLVIHMGLGEVFSEVM